MLIIMKPNSMPQQIETVVHTVKKHGLTPHITHGVETTIIAAVGELLVSSLDPFEVLEGVESVKRISQPYTLGSRQAHPENSVFPIDGFQVGGDDIAVHAHGGHQRLSRPRIQKAGVIRRSDCFSG